MLTDRNPYKMPRLVTPRTVLFAPLFATVLGGCKVKDPPPITGAWTDGFDRSDIGSDYFQTGPGFSISDGALLAADAQNHPLWLRKKLPKNCRVTFTATALSATGDIKVELFGDGLAYDPDGGGYSSSGYVVIFGGWNNSKSMIAKGDEHGQQVVVRTDRKVLPNTPYAFTLERQDGTLTWYLGGEPTPFLQYVDPTPLTGPGHEYLGFGNWQAPTRFDNLTISPL